MMNLAAQILFGMQFNSDQGKRAHLSGNEINLHLHYCAPMADVRGATDFLEAGGKIELDWTGANGVRNWKLA